MGALHDRAVVAQVRQMLHDSDGSIASGSRLTGLLTLLELEVPSPLFMSHSAIAKVLHCNPPKLGGLRALIANLGFNVSQTHCDPEGIKTDAPVALIWDLFRIWLRDHAVSSKRENRVASRLISMDLQVLNESDYNESSPFYEHVSFTGADPVHKEISLLNNPHKSTSDEHSKRQFEAPHAADNRGYNASGHQKRPRLAAGGPLFPKNPEPRWGPKKSTGFRGRAGGGGRAAQNTHGEVATTDDIVPSGLGIPEELIQVHSWNDLAGSGPGDDGGGKLDGEGNPEQTATWMRRMFKDTGGGGASLGNINEFVGGRQRPEPRPEEEVENEAAGL